MWGKPNSRKVMYKRKGAKSRKKYTKKTIPNSKTITISIDPIKPRGYTVRQRQLLKQYETKLFSDTGVVLLFQNSKE